jgi:hypothetical protein
MVNTMKSNTIYLVSSSSHERHLKWHVFACRTDGLGQLSDGQTGPDNREDTRGFQWVSEEHSHRSDD